MANQNKLDQNFQLSTNPLKLMYYKKYDIYLKESMPAFNEEDQNSQTKFLVKWLSEHKMWVEKNYLFEHNKQNLKKPHNLIKSIWNWSVSVFSSDKKFYVLYSLQNGESSKWRFQETLKSQNRLLRLKVMSNLSGYHQPKGKAQQQYCSSWTLVNPNGQRQLIRTILTHFLKVIKFRFEQYVLFQSIQEKETALDISKTYLQNILNDPARSDYIIDPSQYNIVNPLEQMDLKDFKDKQNGQNGKQIIQQKRYLPQQIQDYYLTYEERYRWVKKSQHEQQVKFNERQKIIKQNQLNLSRMVDNHQISKVVEIMQSIPSLKIKLTQQQIDLIQNPGNTMGIGRSGTGKTLCQIYRLLALEVLYKITKEDPNKSNIILQDSLKHQLIGLQNIFITASPILANKIKNYYNKLINIIMKELDSKIKLPEKQDDDYLSKSISLIDSIHHQTSMNESYFEQSQFNTFFFDQNLEDFNFDNNDEFSQDLENECLKGEMIQQQLNIVPQNNYPQFQTVHSYLLQIESYLDRRFFQGMEGNQINQNSQNTQNLFLHQNLKLNSIQEKINQHKSKDEEQVLEKEKFYSNHQLSHYDSYMREQFLNFKQLRKQEIKNFEDESKSRKFEVDYNYFANYFWPIASIKFKCSSRISCSCLWTEIFSFIKGSPHSYQYKNQYLPRNEYLNLKDNSLLTCDQKNLVYNMFELYEKWKSKQCGYDLMDLVNYILSEIKAEKCNIPSTHFTVIDEVQDLPYAVIQLFSSISESSIFFSGDSAQTIARGVGFKFGDLKTLFKNQNITQSLSLSSPSVHQLTINFRSHNGILQLSNSVINLLEIFFPMTIDCLQKEYSSQEGVKPIVLVDADQNFLYTLLQGDSSGETLEFGCNQVIIVKDDESKQKLPPILQHAICLTVYEAKGLEFDDVILYDFFSNSGCTYSQWDSFNQITEQSFKEVQSDTIQDDINKQIQNEGSQNEMKGKNYNLKGFNLINNALLCSELKQLYTAITRPKQRLIIFDSEEYKRKSILKYWVQQNLVIQISPKDLEIKDNGQNEKDKQDLISHFKKILVSNTQQQWYEQGIKMFKNQYYEQAVKCFKNSNHKDLEQRVNNQFFFIIKTIIIQFQQYQAQIYHEVRMTQQEIVNIENQFQLLKLNIGKFAMMNESSKQIIKQDFNRQITLFKQNLIKLGDKLLDINLKKQAANCYFQGENYESAGNIYQELNLFKEAANSYLLSKTQFEKAALIYEQINEVDQAIKCLEFQENWYHLLILLSRHPEYQISDFKKNEYISKCFQDFNQPIWQNSKQQQQDRDNEDFSITFHDITNFNEEDDEQQSQFTFIENNEPNTKKLEDESFQNQSSEISFSIDFNFKEDSKNDEEKIIKEGNNNSFSIIQQDEDYQKQENDESLINEEELRSDLSITPSQLVFKRAVNCEDDIYKMQKIFKLFINIDSEFKQLCIESIKKRENIIFGHELIKDDEIVAYLGLQDSDGLDQLIIQHLLRILKQYSLFNQMWFVTMYSQCYSQIPKLIILIACQNSPITQNNCKVSPYHVSQSKQRMTIKKVNHRFHYIYIISLLNQRNQVILKIDRNNKFILFNQQEKLLQQCQSMMQNIQQTIESLIENKQFNSKNNIFNQQELQQLILMGYWEQFTPYFKQEDQLDVLYVFGKLDLYLQNAIKQDKNSFFCLPQIEPTRESDIKLSIISLEYYIQQLIQKNLQASKEYLSFQLPSYFACNIKLNNLITLKKNNNNDISNQLNHLLNDVINQVQQILNRQESKLNQINIFDTLTTFTILVKYFEQLDIERLINKELIYDFYSVLIKVINILPQAAVISRDLEMQLIIKAILSVFQVRTAPKNQLLQIFGKERAIIDLRNDLIHSTFLKDIQKKKEQINIYFCDISKEYIIIPLKIIFDLISLTFSKVSNKLKQLLLQNQNDLQNDNHLQMNEEEQQSKEIELVRLNSDLSDNQEVYLEDEEHSLANTEDRSTQYLFEKLESLKQIDKKKLIDRISKKEGQEVLNIQELFSETNKLIQYGLSGRYNKRHQNNKNTNIEHILNNLIINGQANEHTKLIIPRKYVGYFYQLEEQQFLIRDTSQIVKFKSEFPNSILLNINDYDNSSDFQFICKYILENIEKSKSRNKTYFYWILTILANIYDLEQETLLQLISILKQINFEQQTHSFLSQNKLYKQLLSSKNIEDINSIAYDLVISEEFEALFGVWEDITVYNDAHHEMNKQKFEDDKQQCLKSVQLRKDQKKVIQNFMIKNKKKIKIIRNIDEIKLSQFLQLRSIQTNQSNYIKEMKHILIANQQGYQNIIQLIEIKEKIINYFYQEEKANYEILQFVTQKQNEIQEYQDDLISIFNDTIELRLNRKFRKYINYDHFQQILDTSKILIDSFKSEIVQILSKNNNINSQAQQKKKVVVKPNTLLPEQQKTILKKIKQERKNQQKVLMSAILNQQH